jgi:hypothetical protein
LGDEMKKHLVWTAQDVVECPPTPPPLTNRTETRATYALKYKYAVNGK